jgi:hypothetical protein
MHIKKVATGAQKPYRVITPPARGQFGYPSASTYRGLAVFIVLLQAECLRFDRLVATADKQLMNSADISP